MNKKNIYKKKVLSVAFVRKLGLRLLHTGDVKSISIKIGFKLFFTYS